MTSKGILAVLQRRGIVRKKGEDDYEFVNGIIDMTKPERFKQLVKDALVPFQLRSSSGGKYFATRVSQAGLASLTKLLTVDCIPYEDVVTVVKAYYSTSDTNKLALSKLLSDGLVEGMCAEIKNGATFDGSGEDNTTML